MANTVRIQFDVSPERLAELESLMRTCRLATKKELFNNALTLFEWAVNTTKDGYTIASVNEKENRYRELHMPSIDAAR